MMQAPAIDSIRSLLATLVATPSQAPDDDLSAIVQVLTHWLRAHGVPYTCTGPQHQPSAIVINPPESAHDELFVLNACVDTAPVGDLAQWHWPALQATESDGWLYGRGSADSKAAVAIFCELARTTPLLAAATNGGTGAARRRVSIVFDCDEHSGNFGGIRAYTQTYGFPNYCAIGYPGITEVVSGSRGFYRTVIGLHGSMGHSGSGTVPGELAATKLQQLIAALDQFSAAPAPLATPFPLPPRASVTWLNTGVQTYSVTAAKIECAIDIRLTPQFGPDAARRFLDQTLAGIAARCGNDHPSTLSEPNCWPAYKTPDDALLPQLLLKAAQQAMGTALPLAISGPSNIGNYLAQHGSQVLSGFGVDFKNIHGPDECIRLASIADVFNVYRAAVRNYVSA